MWTFKRKEQTVIMNRTYFGQGEVFRPLKRQWVGGKFLNLRPDAVPMATRVSHEKRRDVEKLLQFISIDEDGVKFYDQALKDAITKSKRAMRFENPVEIE